MNKLLIPALFTACAMPGGEALAGSTLPAPASVEATIGTKDGDATGMIDLFVPLYGGPDRLLFTDVRALLGGGDNGMTQGSLGLGFRFAPNETWVIGINGYYDYLESDQDNQFHRLGLGLEALSTDWEVRANAYVPLGDVEKAVEAYNAVLFENNRLIYRAGEEAALQGFDAEVGYRLPFFSEDDLSQIKGFVGGYWYEGENVESLPGVAAGLEFSRGDLPWLGNGSRLTLVAGVSYDDENDVSGTLLARLRVPLGDTSAQKPYDPMYARVDRADEIRTYVGSIGEAEAAIYVATGQQAGGLVTIDGTRTPSAVNASITAAGDGALVLASGIANLDGTIRLGTGSFLTSGGSSILIRGARTGGTAVYSAPGSAGTLNGTNSAADVVAMGQSSTIASIAISGGRDAITASNVDNLRVDNVSISSIAGNGFTASGVSGVWFSNVGITDAGGSAIALSNVENALFDNLSFSASGASLPAMDGFALFSRMAAPAAPAGIVLTHVDGAQFSNIELALAGGNGIVANGVNNVKLSNVSLSGEVGSGFTAIDATNLSVNGLSMAGIRGYGISLSNVDGAAFNNVNIAHTGGGDGIIANGVSNVQLSNVSLSGNVRSGFTTADSTDLSVDGLDMAGLSGYGLSLTNVDGATFDNVSLALTGGDDGVVATGVSNLQFTNVGISGVLGKGIALTDASDVLIGNATISGAFGNGISATGVDELQISNVSIADVGGHGIVVTDANNVQINAATITRVGGDGIFAADTTGLQVTNADISVTGSHGIQLANVDGALIASTRIHDLTICESSTDCEWSIFNPNEVYYAGINGLDVQNLTVRDVVLQDVTYGLFFGSQYEEIDWENTVIGRSENITVENLSITNSRREGILLVGVETASLTDISIDNSAIDRSMDLIVLQKSAHIVLDNLNLKGGINGLMFASSFNLPGQTTDIAVSNIWISDSSRAGIFMNPATDVSFTNVNITNVGSNGFYIYGDAFGFAGGPISGISFDDVSVTNSGETAVYISGPIDNMNGNIATTNVPAQCSADPSPWSGTELTQGAGSVFSIGGNAIPVGTLSPTCGL